MRKNLVIVSLCLTVLLGLFACSADENGGGVDIDGSDTQIRANAQSVSLLSVVTKAPYDETTPSADHPLKARVLASKTSDSYSVLHADGTMTFTGTGQTPYDTDDFTGKNYYELTGSLYFCALYPDTAWTASPTTTASFTFYGKEDVMFAPQATSDITQAASKPEFQFEHLLTRLNITLVGEDGGISDAWGEITELALTSVPNIVTVTLNGTDMDKVAPTYSGSATINAHLVSDDDTPVSADTPATIALKSDDPGTPVQPQAYILAAPVTIGAAYEYTLHIKTSNGSVRTIGLDLMTEATGSTRGRSFNVTLNFLGDQIFVETNDITLEEWTPSLVLQTIMFTSEREIDAKNMMFGLNVLNTINDNSRTHTYTYFGLYGVNDITHPMEFDVKALSNLNLLFSFTSKQHVMFDLKKLIRTWGKNENGERWAIVLTNYEGWELTSAKQTINLSDHTDVDWTAWAAIPGNPTIDEVENPTIAEVDGITSATLPRAFPLIEGGEKVIPPSPILTNKGTIIIRRINDDEP